jgi:hypothetical protein
LAAPAKGLYFCKTVERRYSLSEGRTGQGAARTRAESLKASPAPVGSGILGVMSFVGAGFGGRHAPALEPAATKGGDPNDTYKRWFGCVSGRAGWGRGSSLVGTSCWPAGHRGMRAGSLSRARSSPTDGRSDAVAVRITLVRGQKRSGGKGGVQFDSALFLSLATVRLT